MASRTRAARPSRGLPGGGSISSLPYTVKGMDLAFSGLVSAAQDSTAALEDVCNGLQETAFAMCVEVTERALAHADKGEVLLVGGVGANARLQEMLGLMCEDRGAAFAVPDRKFLGDNGAMIAYTGKVMLEHGVTLSLEESRVRPGYRPDEVDIVWRAEPGEIFAAEPHEGASPVGRRPSWRSGRRMWSSVGRVSGTEIRVWTDASSRSGPALRPV